MNKQSIDCSCTNGKWYVPSWKLTTKFPFIKSVSKTLQCNICKGKGKVYYLG